jgi:GT2 family glycosyltransferase
MGNEKHPRVSVIIVNWNGLHHLPVCLESLKTQSFDDFEVVVVDNGSVDGSIEFLKREHPWVKTVPLEQNTGFARGNNVGFENCTGDYIVTLNNDTRVDKNWLAALVKVADEHPEVGMVGSRICSFDNPDILDSLGVKICLDGMSRGAFRNQSFSELKVSGTLEILLPSACAALYKRRMLEEIGFFDEDFFAYCEDTDLGLRGRISGWEALLNTEAIVYHKYSQTGGGFSPFKLYLVERNHYWVVLRNFPLLWLAMFPFATLWRYFEQLRVVLFSDGSGQEFLSSGKRLDCLLSLLKGHRDALLASPSMLKKRRGVMRKCKISSHSFGQMMKKHAISFRELLDNAG